MATKHASLESGWLLLLESDAKMREAFIYFGRRVLAHDVAEVDNDSATVDSGVANGSCLR